MSLNRYSDLFLYKYNTAEKRLDMCSVNVQFHRTDEYERSPPCGSSLGYWNADSRSTVAATILQDDLCKGVPQPSRSHDIVRATIIVTIFTYFFFTLRCISRYMVARRLWWDDWCLISAVVSLYT